MKTKIVPGLVIALPKDTKHEGVIISCTKAKVWFKVVIITYDGDVATCKMMLKKDNKHFYYRDYHLYDVNYAAKLLK